MALSLFLSLFRPCVYVGPVLLPYYFAFCILLIRGNLHLALRAGRPSPFDNEQDTAKQIACDTGGIYEHVDDGGDLSQAMAFFYR